MVKNRYDRRIRYIDYLVNGARQQGGGFVKLEERGGQCYFTMRIGGLRLAGSLLCPIYFIGYSGEEMVGEVSLRSGQGSWECSQPNPEHLFRTGIAYDDIRAIRVSVAAGRELYCRVREQEGMPEERAESVVSSDAGRVMQAASLERMSTGAEEESEPIRVAPSQNGERTSIGVEDEREGRHPGTKEEREPIRARMGQDDEQPSTDVDDEQEWVGTETEERELIRTDTSQNGEQPSTSVDDERKRMSIGVEEREPTRVGSDQNGERTSTGTEDVRLWEEKWKQLTEIYPNRNPFQDEREYLTLGPSDFVVLSESSYRLVSNSFLLHGYYNYQHLILTRQPKRGELRYYIGVPGNYYEREKQVAVMFGFESFECKSEPAREGDFGYYMIPVNL